MGLLHITELRRGANGRHPHAPQTPPTTTNPELMRTRVLPNPLVMKSGKEVTSASAWWKQLPPRDPQVIVDRHLSLTTPENAAARFP